MLWVLLEVPGSQRHFQRVQTYVFFVEKKEQYQYFWTEYQERSLFH